MSKVDKLVRIVIADDHPIFREGISTILDNQPDMTVVGDCGNGQEAVSIVLRERPDVAILDLQMPEMSGAEATIAIRREFHDAKILLLTTFDGNEDIHRAMRAGAHGYLLKESRKDEILQAIRTIARGNRYLSPSVGASLATCMPLQQLTKREREILQLISQGKSNKDIGVVLCITEGTVKSHVNGMLQKLGFGNRMEAVMLAQREGMLRR